MASPSQVVPKYFASPSKPFDLGRTWVLLGNVGAGWVLGLGEQFLPNMEIRGQQVMLDHDLATLYDVETKALNQAVKRNIERFPSNFRFQLSGEETNELVTNCDRFEKMKHSSSLPFAFTEQGVAMLSAVLRSQTAIRVSIQIMEAFVAMRRFVANPRPRAAQSAVPATHHSGMRPLPRPLPHHRRHGVSPLLVAQGPREEAVCVQQDGDAGGRNTICYSLISDCRFSAHLPPATRHNRHVVPDAVVTHIQLLRPRQHLLGEDAIGVGVGGMEHAFGKGCLCGL